MGSVGEVIPEENPPEIETHGEEDMEQYSEEFEEAEEDSQSANEKQGSTKKKEEKPTAQVRYQFLPFIAVVARSH